MEWFFDGLGTELISVIIGIIFGAVTGGTIGYKIGVNKQSVKQEQKAGTASKQRQIGERDKTIVLDETIGWLCMCRDKKRIRELSESFIFIEQWEFAKRIVM